MLNWKRQIKTTLRNLPWPMLYNMGQNLSLTIWVLVGENTLNKNSYTAITLRGIYIYLKMRNSHWCILSHIQECSALKRNKEQNTEKTSAKWKGNQLYGKTYLPMITWTGVWSPKYIKNSYDSTPGFFNPI